MYTYQFMNKPTHPGIAQQTTCIHENLKTLAVDATSPPIL